VNKISTQDRKALIRLASSMPVGSAERRAVLTGLSKTGFDPRKDADPHIDDQHWEYLTDLERLETDVVLKSADVRPIKMDGKKPKEAYLVDMGRTKDILIGLDGGPRGVTFYGALAPNYPKGPMGPVYEETYRKVRWPSEFLAAFNKFTMELESQIETYGMGDALSKTAGIAEQYLRHFAEAADKHLDVGFDKDRSTGGYVGFEGSRMGRHVIRLSSPRPGKMLVEREWSPDVNDFEEERIVAEADSDDFAPEKKWLTGDLQRDLRTLKGMLR
jgi:hypothetical protein